MTDAAQALGSERVTPMISPEGPHYIECGLTKRELFAAMAMQAILTGAVGRGCPSNEWTDQGMAVRCADALLQELSK